MIIALLGAESTGKTTLSLQLATELAARAGRSCTAVPEVLRGWCERAGRTPRVDEQAGIAALQAEAIDAAAQTHDIVIADTSPLMIAIYSEYVFGDRSLIADGQAFHRRCDLTLLTALDIEWEFDGLQREGPHVRPPIDALIRHALIDGGLSWSVVSGQGPARLDAALNAITPLLARPGNGLFTRLQHRQEALPQRAWLCDCDVPECEHLSFRRHNDADEKTR